MPLTPIQNDFAKYLAGLWRTKCTVCRAEPENHDTGECITRNAALNAAIKPCNFWHQYPITRHPAWVSWRDGEFNGAAADVRHRQLRARFWWCCSLGQAADHYSWTAHRNHTFERLSGRMLAAMRQQDNEATRQVCFDIFKWGNVARKRNDVSLAWVRESNTLIQDIDHAVALLQPGNGNPLDSFDLDLLMNSAMTKVYTAADRTGNVIIYDGRVGAALGLLTRLYLQSLGQNSVPDDLAFLWGPMWGAGASNPRNPSLGVWEFSSLYHYGIRNRQRAEVARMAGEVLNQMRNLLLPEIVTMRDIEKALFMVGYRVR